MITAFVPTLNNEKTIGRVLKAIKAQTVRPKRIIVIDSGSADATESICLDAGVEFYPKSYFGDFEILGLGRARNRILELIDTPYLLSVDSDIILRPDHIEKILPMFAEDPAIAGIAGRQIELNRIHMGDKCRALVDMRDLYNESRKLKDEFRPFLMGSNNIYRTDALHIVGMAENGNKFRPFEDAFMSNYEDADVGHKLTKHGYKLLWTPSVPTYHLQKDDVRSYINRAYRYRVFKWLRNGGFETEEAYAGKIEHNINYVRMGINIITEKQRSYLAYPFFLAGFSFFIEDILHFEQGHPMARKIYNSFLKSMEHCKSEELKRGILEFNRLILDNITLERTEEYDERILEWFMSLADLSAFHKKFPAMHDTKLTETDENTRISCLTASKKRMEAEENLNIYGNFKVMLMNLPWRKENGRYGVRAGSRWPHTYDMGRYDSALPPYIPYPFFLGHTFSLLQRAGISSWMCDAVAEGYTEEEAIFEAFGYEPNLIIAEVSVPSLTGDLKTLSDIKAFLPDTKICITGPLPKDIIAQLAEKSFIDHIIDGEYEFAALKLAQDLKHKRMTQKTVPMERQDDYAQLPVPERLFTPFYNYNDRPVAALKYPSLQIQLSRGCPFGCSFCVLPSVFYGDRYRKGDIVKTVNEIEKNLKTFGIQSFYADDDTFNVDKRHVAAFAHELIDRGLNLPWMAMARADTLNDKELLTLLKESGLIGLKFGIESTNQAVLAEMNKKLNIEKCQETFEICRELGIGIHLTFTLGYLADTPVTAENTFRWLIGQNPDSMQVSLTIPFPGTPMFDTLKNMNVLTDMNMDGYDGADNLPFETPMGRDRVKLLKQQWIAAWLAFKKGERTEASQLTAFSDPHGLSEYIGSRL